MPFILIFLSFDISLLCYKGIVEGHCPSLVTRGDSVIQESVKGNEKFGSRLDPLSLCYATKSHYPGLVTIYMVMSYRYMSMVIIGWLVMRPPIHQLIP
jgi:hypothetical protein